MIVKAVAMSEVLLSEKKDLGGRVCVMLTLPADDGLVVRLLLEAFHQIVRRASSQMFCSLAKVVTMAIAFCRSLSAFSS
jgi:hypothetical protein